MTKRTGATILVVGGVDATATPLASAVADITDGSVDVERADDRDRAVAVAERVASSGGFVPIAFVDYGLGVGELAVDEVVALHEVPALASTRIVLVPPTASLHDVDRALRSGAVHGMITRPWTREGLARVTAAHLATFLVEHAPDRLGDFDDLLDTPEIERAGRRIALRRAAPAHETERLHPLLDTSSEDEELEAQLVEMLDRALGHPPRLRVAPGTVLIEHDEDVGGIFVVLDGTVRLTSRTPTGEQILHERSTGSIIGLLSLASRRRAVLQCRAVTEVRAIPVTLDQLAHALDVEPALSGLLNRVLIGSLARRLRRSDALQVELDQSLAALSEARAELVSTARLRTLGELSAGLAHELNNPAAALVRSLDHLLDDLTGHELVDPAVAAEIERSYGSRVRSTAETRALRRSLTDSVGDRALADRLVAMGVTDPAAARRLIELPPAELARLEVAARVGRTIRDAESAAHRMQGLVDNLRAHARGDGVADKHVADVDVARTITSALRLLAHRTGEFEIETHLGDVPHVSGRPGALQSVWSNLLANAIDAVSERAEGGGVGHVTVVLDQPDPQHVRVQVADDGPGIPPDLVERIFEPRFTTKGGRVRFGLGLGLSIARQIVDDHDGTITVESRPGRTVFCVRLPVGDSDE